MSEANGSSERDQHSDHEPSTEDARAESERIKNQYEQWIGEGVEEQRRAEEEYRQQREAEEHLDEPEAEGTAEGSGEESGKTQRERAEDARGRIRRIGRGVREAFRKNDSEHPANKPEPEPDSKPEEDEKKHEKPRGFHSHHWHRRQERARAEREGRGRPESERRVPGEREISELLSYADILTGKEREDAIEETSRNESARKYADTLREMAGEFGMDEIRSTAGQLKEECLDILEKAGLPHTRFTDSDTWAIWDLAKQRYYFQHPDEATGPYKHDLGDPFSEDPGERYLKRGEIVDCQVGWELTQTPHAELPPGLDKLRDGLEGELVADLRDTPHSYELERWGWQVRRQEGERPEPSYSRYRYQPPEVVEEMRREPVGEPTRGAGEPETWEQDRFQLNSIVKVRRSGGEFEEGWRVSGFEEVDGQTYVAVRHSLPPGSSGEPRFMEKMVSRDELEGWQSEQTSETAPRVEQEPNKEEELTREMRPPDEEAGESEDVDDYGPPATAEQIHEEWERTGPKPEDWGKRMEAVRAAQQAGRDERKEALEARPESEERKQHFEGRKWLEGIEKRIRERTDKEGKHHVRFNAEVDLTYAEKLEFQKNAEVLGRPLLTVSENTFGETGKDERFVSRPGVAIQENFEGLGFEALEDGSVKVNYLYQTAESSYKPGVGNSLVVEFVVDKADADRLARAVVRRDYEAIQFLAEDALADMGVPGDVWEKIRPEEHFPMRLYGDVPEVRAERKVHAAFSDEQAAEELGYPAGKANKDEVEHLEDLSRRFGQKEVLGLIGKYQEFADKIAAAYGFEATEDFEKRAGKDLKKTITRDLMAYEDPIKNDLSDEEWGTVMDRFLGRYALNVITGPKKKSLNEIEKGIRGRIFQKATLSLDPNRTAEELFSPEELRQIGAEIREAMQSPAREGEEITKWVDAENTRKEEQERERKRPEEEEKKKKQAKEQPVIDALVAEGHIPVDDEERESRQAAQKAKEEEEQNLAEQEKFKREVEKEQIESGRLLPPSEAELDPEKPERVRLVFEWYKGKLSAEQDDKARQALLKKAAGQGLFTAKDEEIEAMETSDAGLNTEVKDFFTQELQKKPKPPAKPQGGKGAGRGGGKS